MKKLNRKKMNVKEKRSSLKTTGMALVASVMMLTSSLPVLAAGSNYTPTIEGVKTTNFDTYLVMDQQSNVPNVSFQYEVTAGEAKSYDLDGKKFEVLSGVNAGQVVMSGVGTADNKTIAFTSADTTAKNTNNYVKNYDSQTKKYAGKTATLDFTKCTYTEPGVYRYIVTQSGANQAVTNDADSTRVLDVYVYDASTADTKKLSIAGYVLHSDVDDAPAIQAGVNAGSTGSYAGTKTQGFTNEYDTSDLSFKKEVSGNQASKDKYFEFTVQISNAVPGTIYQVDLSNADVMSGTNTATIAANAGKANPATLTTGADGSVSQKFYLQHGQEIRIQGIAKTTEYDVTEKKEDYKATPAGVAGYQDPVKGTIASTDLHTSYLNTRDGAIPTGVTLVVAPYLILMLVSGLSILTIIMKKRREG